MYWDNESTFAICDVKDIANCHRTRPYAICETRRNKVGFRALSAENKQDWPCHYQRTNRNTLISQDCFSCNASTLPTHRPLPSHPHLRTHWQPEWTLRNIQQGKIRPMCFITEISRIIGIRVASRMHHNRHHHEALRTYWALRLLIPIFIDDMTKLNYHLQFRPHLKKQCNRKEQCFLFCLCFHTNPIPFYKLFHYILTLCILTSF